MPAGTGPFTFVWSLNGTVDFPKRDQQPDHQCGRPANAGQYVVVVTGLANTVTNFVTVTLNTLTSATTPANLMKNPGDSATFTTTASGTGPFSYVWSFNGTPLSGQTSNSLTIAPVTLASAGTYSVAVIGDCNTVTNSATLSVGTATTFTLTPTNAVECAGDTVTITATVSGTGPFSYAWSFNGTPLPTQTTGSLTVSPVIAASAGTYTLVVTGSVNSATNSAVLTVNPPNTVTVSPASQIVNSGGSATFTAVTGGVGPFSYLWSYNGTILSSATGSSITIAPVSATNAGTYTVAIIGACNTATGSGVLVTNAPPTVSIISPTNGATFLALANYTVLAAAQDSDGTISKVEFFALADDSPNGTNGTPGFNQGQPEKQHL